MLKKELVKTQNKELERGGEYRQLLVQCIHQCAVKFPDVAGSVVHLMMEFLSDNSTIGALPLAAGRAARAPALHCACCSRARMRPRLHLCNAGQGARRRRKGWRGSLRVWVERV